MATFIAGLIMAKESSILNFDVYINVEDGVLGLGICLLVFALYKLIRADIECFSVEEILKKSRHI